MTLGRCEIDGRYLVYVTTAQRAGDYYDRVAPDMERLRSEVDFALRGELARRSLAIHSILSRVKERESFVNKMAIRGYTDPAHEIQDFVGARIVCLYLPEIAAVDDVVRALFRVTERDDKIVSAPANAFGYMSVHYTCALGDAFTGARYEGLQDLRFEVQVRTLLMDAWASVSHHLAYKGEASVPDALRRDFHALAGLFYVADRQFGALADAARHEQEQAIRQVVEADGSGALREVPINQATLVAYLRIRFPERPADQPDEVAELAEELAAAGYTSLAQVESRVDEASGWLLEEETQNDDADENASTSPDAADWHTPAGAVRRSLVHTDERFSAVWRAGNGTGN